MVGPVRAAWVLLWLAAAPSWAVQGQEIRVVPTSQEGVYGLEVRALLDARPAAVRHVVMRYCDMRERFAFLDVCDNFMVAGDLSWTYGVIAPPIISSRDYIITGRVARDLDPDGGGVFQMDWWADDGVGPLPRPGIIRMRVNQGSYHLTPAQDGKRTALTYQLRLAPGGWVPTWVAKLAGRQAASEQVWRIERLAREVDRDGRVVMPVPGAPWGWIVPVTPKFPMRPPAPASRPAPSG
jgi:hypothetical protein